MPHTQDRTHEVLVCLRRIIQTFDVHSRYLSRKVGLTGPQLMVLDELVASGPLTVGQVAVGVSLSQATLTGILERMERRGLIRRERSDVDRRKVLVAVTEEGRILHESSPPLMQESFTKGFQNLPVWEQTMILSSLQRIVDMMGEKGISGGEDLIAGADGGRKAGERA